MTTKTQTQITDLFAEVVARRINYDHHESDLYIPVTEETTALIERYEFKNAVKTFRAETKGKHLWYEIPFAFTSFWNK